MATQPVHSMEGHLPLPMEQPMETASLALKTSWRTEAAKANMGVASLLDLKAEPQDVVTLDNYVQPVDRGPAAADPGLLRSWQYAATGKVATANVLTELKCEHIKSGGPQGVIEKACREISTHSLDDTFYIVDLGNVLRMYKVMHGPLADGLWVGNGSMVTHRMGISITGSQCEASVLPCQVSMPMRACLPL